MQDGRQMVKDGTALAVIVAAGGAFVLRACAEEDALWHAGRVARNAATVVAPLAGVAGFALAKTHNVREYRRQTLETTLVGGSLGALTAGVLGALGSLAWDALRA